MVTHSGIPAQRIPWIEEPDRPQSVRSQRVGHDQVANTFTFLVYNQAFISWPQVLQNCNILSKQRSSQYNFKTEYWLIASINLKFLTQNSPLSNAFLGIKYDFKIHFQVLSGFSFLLFHLKDMPERGACCHDKELSLK